MTRPVVLCAGCGLGLRPNQPHTYREVVALERVSNTGATTPTLRRKRYTGLVFCPACANPPPAATLDLGEET
jgi:hypothetical protein